MYNDVKASEGLPSLIVDGFEVNLDQKKLKTPTGGVFRVPTEPLALMVATEWDAQHETINRHSMHLVRMLTYFYVQSDHFYRNILKSGL